MFSRWGVCGELWKDKVKLCDTVEAPDVMLAPGKYEMEMRWKKKYKVHCLTMKGHALTALIPRNGPFGLRGSCSVCIGKSLMTGVLGNVSDAVTNVSDAVLGNNGKIWLEVI